MTTDLMLTDWFPCTTPPVREGVYEVDLENCNGSNPILCEFADGEWPDRPGINKYPREWKWRGVRRWVLQIPALFGPGPDYLIGVSRRGVIRSMARLHDKWCPNQPITFDTKEAAVAYAMSKRELRVIGWKAVLP